jgi:hypothetical protein
LVALARIGDVTKALAHLPVLPAIEDSRLPGGPAGLGTSAFTELPKPGAPMGLPGQITDPEELINSALAILAGHKIAPTPTLDLPPPQGPLLRADKPPVNVGRQDVPNALPLQRRVLSDGTMVPLPVRYFDAQCLLATFTAELSSATSFLKGTELQAVPQDDKKALALLGCFEYRTTDIGPYNEACLAILTIARGDPIPAWYVMNLPVTTSAANRAGREIWGFNKFVTAIEVERKQTDFWTIVHDPGNAKILTLQGTSSASVSTPPADVLTFSYLSGKLLKTIVRVMTPFKVSGGGNFVLNVGTSTHPMADNLRTLGLDGARPVLLQYADPFQSLLFPGQAV